MYVVDGVAIPALTQTESTFSFPHAGSLALAGPAVLNAAGSRSFELDDGDDEAELDAEPEAEADEDGDADAEPGAPFLAAFEGLTTSGRRYGEVPVVLPCAAAMTARKLSCELRESESSTCWLGFPGMETTMSFSPSVVTSASDVPVASTRLRMMSTACLTWLELTLLPPVTTGSRTTVRPPSRSSPSFGVQCPVAAMPPTRTRNRARSTAKPRLGLVCFGFLRAAGRFASTV